jgi:hypothetical protein
MEKDMINSKQNAWNFASLFVYFLLLVLVGYLLEREKIDITSLTFRDLAFITLATYRLTRIVVFEKIFKFCRDFVKARQDYKVFNTIRYIITCPWCAGVWMALVTVVFYLLVPYGKFLVYILAISGVASFLIMLVNAVGLIVEEKQSKVKKD